MMIKVAPALFRIAGAIEAEGGAAQWKPRAAIRTLPGGCIAPPLP
jgi:hypothetical protein